MGWINKLSIKESVFLFYKLVFYLKSTNWARLRHKVVPLTLKESQEPEEMKGYAKEKLESSNEILTIGAIRKKYGLSLVDAKKIMDFAKKASIQESDAYL